MVVGHDWADLKCKGRWKRLASAHYANMRGGPGPSSYCGPNKDLSYVYNWLVFGCILVIADLKFGRYPYAVADGTFWPTQVAAIIALVCGYLYHAVSLRRQVL
jgi:hypothetical protein